MYTQRQSRNLLPLPNVWNSPWLLFLVGSPVLVVLNILCQVHIQHDEVVNVAARERLLDLPALGFTRPLPHPNQGVVGDVGSWFDMLENLLQGDIPFSPCVFTGRDGENVRSLERLTAMPAPNNVAFTFFFHLSNQCLQHSTWHKSHLKWQWKAKYLEA